MRRIAALALAALALTLAGCGMLDYWRVKDTTQPPSPLVDFKPLAKVETVWSHGVGAGTGEEYIKLAPAVDGKRVFAADRKGRVYAFDAESGSEIWRTSTERAISGGPGVADGLVLVGTSGGRVLALSEQGGKVLWTARVSSEVLAAPAAADGVVVARTSDGKLFGLDEKDGKRLWVYERTVPVLTLRGTSGPVISDGVVVAGFDSGVLVALSLKTAQTLWETRVAIPTGRSELERMVDIDATPVIAGSTVYVVTFHGRIAAVDMGSGRILWRRDMSSSSGLAVDVANVYVSDDQSHVWALDRFTSASLWRQKKLEARRVSGPAVIGDYVVVGDLEGYVHWLRREDGQFAARARVGSDPILAAPVAANGLLYVYGSGGDLAALKVQ